MVRARRSVLDAGHWDSLRDVLLDRLRGDLLDLGCGEGFYTRPLDNAWPNWVGGIDVSKTAIRLAARRASSIEYAVANAFRVPISDASLDTVLSVFGPLPGGQIRRVLRKGGQAVVVAPGPRHLAQLKATVFDHVALHSRVARSALDTQLARVSTHRLTYERVIREPLLTALLDMTPYRWHADSRGRDRLGQLGELAVTIDFLILNYQR